MVAFPNVKEGDVLWDCRWERTTEGRRWKTYQVHVVSINHVDSVAVVRHNWGEPRTVTARYFTPLCRAKEVRGGGHETTETKDAR